MNIVIKFLLVSTSLSPVFLIVVVNQLERGKSWTSWIGWLIAALILVGLCWRLLGSVAKRAPRALLDVKEFERKDQEMLTFLFIYLLPFIRTGSSTFASEPFTSIFTLAAIILALAQAGAFHFNPVMFVLGYRFYAIKNPRGVSNLLISKGILWRPDQIGSTVQIANNVYLQMRKRNV